MRKGTVKNKKRNRKEKETKRKEGRRTGKEKEKKGEGKRRGATETSMKIYEKKSKISVFIKLDSLYIKFSSTFN